MWLLCWLWLHSWELKTVTLEKRWFLVNFLEQNGFGLASDSTEQITVHYKQCPHCLTIKPTSRGE